jgi:putative oxidoreductase
LILGGIGHFKSTTIAYAASAGVPMAGFLVPASGALAVLGGLLVALGFKARIGAAMIAAFLIPVTLSMHAFWNATDPQMAMFQQLFFLKNVSMLGGALLLMHFGSGPFSLDARLGTGSVRESENER